MSDTSPEPAEFGPLVTNLFWAVAVTVLVVYSFWDLSVPAIELTTEVLLAVGAGIGVGTLIAILQVSGVFDPIAESTVFYWLAAGGIIGIALFAISAGLPLAVELGVLALGWMQLLAAVALARMGPATA